MEKKTKIFTNQVVDKKKLKQIMKDAFIDFGMMKASYLGDELKSLGFHYATQAGLSLSIEDLRVPPSKKNLVSLANLKVKKADLEVQGGNITEVERFQNVIQTWTTTSESLKDQVVAYFSERDPLNSVYMMAFSGARGNLSQVRQLVGMRGLMADPNGQIIDLPIIKNFREGLTVTDYIISSYGARKGLVDTALRTADSGYLTRRLIDVAHEMVTREKTCKSENGIIIQKVEDLNQSYISLYDRCLGRVLAQSVIDEKSGKVIVEKNKEITAKVAEIIFSFPVDYLIIKSPLTCASSRDVCQDCYGWNLAYGDLVDLGESIGIIAAQSIGEPGTQLTMRTFHTGGVFTTEPSRQIKASCSGQIVFSPKLKTEKMRTPYGEFGYQTKNDSTLSLVNYANVGVNLQVSANTLILVGNNSFVSKGEVLYELLPKTIKTGAEQAFKRVYAKQSGEIILEKNGQKERKKLKNLASLKSEFCSLWILSGEVFSLPFTSSLKIQPNSSLRNGQSVGESIVVSPCLGKILVPKTKREKANVLSFYAFSSNFYLEKQEKGFYKTVIYGRKNRKMIFSISKSFDKNTFFLGEITNAKYQTKTGGQLYSSTFLPKKVSAKTKRKTHGTVFYCPESSYEMSQEILDLNFKNGAFLKKNSEFVKNKLVQNSAFVEILETKKGSCCLVLRPGKFIEVKKAKKLVNYHKTILYPGEKLSTKVKIKNLTYSEIKTFQNKSFLCLYPIVRYEISKEKKESSFFGFPSFFKGKNLSLKKLPFIHSFSSSLKGSSPFQLVEPYKVINLDNFNLNLASFKSKIKKKLKNKVRLKSQKKIKAKYKKTLKLCNLEFLVFKKTLPKEVKEKDLLFSYYLNKVQVVEPYTKLASFQVVAKKENKILFVKQQSLQNEKKILLTTSNNYKEVFVDEASSLFNKNKSEFLKQGEKTKTNFTSPFSGFMKDLQGDRISLHLGQPYLFSQGAILEKRVGDLIKEGESLGRLIYERARTGDIVQGLPKVEKVFEARKPKVQAILAKYPGWLGQSLISTNKKKPGIHLYLFPLRYEPFGSDKEREGKPNKEADKEKKEHQLYKNDYHLVPFSQRIIVGHYEFVDVGQPLSDEFVNPHNLLQTYYIYYQYLGLTTKDFQNKVVKSPEKFTSFFSSQYSCAYASFRRIQSLLLTSVQGVYYSQGVNIADKHVEVIIKQMTNKVEVTSTGESPLAPYELLKLKHAHYVNTSIDQKEDKANFHPVLLGITKASLKTNSFISAASFQHTTKILTEAAILGKVDWLHGLKENVIIGRLIPSGTGLTSYIDISHLKTMAPKKRKERLLPQNDKLSQNYKTENKTKNSKNRNKFKFVS